jgi:hypothetical protein
MLGSKLYSAALAKAERLADLDPEFPIVFCFFIIRGDSYGFSYCPYMGLIGIYPPCWDLFLCSS